MVASFTMLHEQLQIWMSVALGAVFIAMLGVITFCEDSQFEISCLPDQMPQESLVAQDFWSMPDVEMAELTARRCEDPERNLMLSSTHAGPG